MTRIKMQAWEKQAVKEGVTLRGANIMAGLTALIWDGDTGLGKSPRRYRITMSALQLQRLVEALEGIPCNEQPTILELAKSLQKAKDEGYLSEFNEVIG